MSVSVCVCVCVTFLSFFNIHAFVRCFEITHMQISSRFCGVKVKYILNELFTNTVRRYSMEF